MVLPLASTKNLLFRAPHYFNNAAALLGREPQGLAIDFTDQSIKIKDTTTPANIYESVGAVREGSLVGPGGKLTYSSPSPKMTLQSGGTFQFNPHNLFLNSAAPANQSVTVKSGLTYAIDITGSVQTTVSGATSGTLTAGTTAFTAASGTLTFASTSGSGTVQVRQTPSASTYVATSGSTVFSLPYEWNTSAVCQGVLEEEARTNLLLQSNTFGTTWTTTNITNLTNTTTGPDGVSTSATLLNETTTNALHGLTQNVTKAASALAYTLTCFAKQGVGRTRVVLSFDDQGGNGAYSVYDLAGGQVGVAATGFGGAAFTSLASSIISVGNGWYRCVLQGTSNAVTTFAAYVRDDSGSGTGALSQSYAGTVGNGVYIYQAQLEQASYISSPLGGSPIFTTTATVTRAADVFSLATSAMPLSASVGTLYTRHQLAANVTSANQVALSLFTDGSNFIELEANNAGGLTAQMQVVASGVSKFATAGGSISLNTSKLASAFASNDLACCLNGGSVGTNATSNIPTMTTFVIGNRGNSSSWLNGYVKQAMYLPRRMTNTELQTVTT